MNRTLLACALGFLASLSFAQTVTLSGILSDELNRNFQSLKEKGDPAPYFMAYEVTEQEACSVAATLGALQGSSCGHGRVLDVTLRVGSPKLDNYHRAQGERPGQQAIVGHGGPSLAARRAGFG